MLAGAITAASAIALVAGAVVGGVSVLGFGGDKHAAGNLVDAPASASNPRTRILHRTHDVYDRYVVSTPSASTDGNAPFANTPAAPGANPVASGPTGPATPAPVGAPANGNDPAPPTRRPTPGPTAPSPPPTTVAGAPPTTAPPSTPPTTVATTPTTRPPGVPADWPANKPIPPMPPNCQQPQLEDNGVWNCQH